MRLKGFFLVSCLAAALTACQLRRVPATENPASASGSVASTQSSSAAPNVTALLDGAVLTSTGAMRFLDSGILEIGDAAAPLTLTVFTEYHCQYCYQFQAEFLPQLLTEFIAAGTLKLRYVIKPLQKYPNSLPAKQALLCAAQHGKGWQMHEALTGQADRSAAALRRLADTIGITAEMMTACAGDPVIAAQLARQDALMAQLDVTLVPTFFLNDEKLVGLPLYTDMRGWVESKN